MLFKRLMAWKEKTTAFAITALVVFFISFSAGVKGQEVIPLNTFLLSVDTKTEGGQLEMAHLQHLFTGMVPTIYLKDEKLKKSEDADFLRIYSDVVSVPVLYDKNPLFSNVEMIRINISKLSDLSLLLDMDQLDEFPGLKYLLFVCTLEICEDVPDKLACELEKIAALLKSSTGKNIVVLYQISIPS